MTQIFWLLSFLLPFQFSYHFNKLTPLIYGFKIDYLIPTLYITDILSVILIGFWIKNNKLRIIPKHILYSISYICFIFLNIYNAELLIPAVYKWIKITELILLILIIKNTKKLDFFKHFIRPLSYSVVIVNVLAFWQFIIKGSVGGLFYFLGERQLLFSDPGISPYPYSTFSHPNSLAGFLLVFLFLFISFKNKLTKKCYYFVVITTLLTLTLTGSLNAFIVLILTLFILKFKLSKKAILLTSIIISFTLPFLKTRDLIDQSVKERLNLAKSTVQIIKTNPLLGVGLNNFIPNLVTTSFRFDNVRQLQPVHNIFLLILSETGVLGFFFFCSLFFLMPSNYFLVPIFFTGLLDHYWLTLNQNMFLFAIIISFSNSLKHAKLREWIKI